MNWKKPARAVLFLLVFCVFGYEAHAQVFQRQRVVPTASSETYPPRAAQIQPSQPINRPPLVQKISVSQPTNPQNSLIKKTVISVPLNAAVANNYNSSQYLIFNQRLQQAMSSKIGIRYIYGSTGPSAYDCSGLVWSVFQAAGINFERSSARTYWEKFEPVYGDDRYRFGTLVFFNGLAHVGIVVDENGFYQASTSKGVTYTPFAGYWAKRITGFRRVPLNTF